MGLVVVHPSLNRGGGAERVCLTVIKALSGRGFRVRLATIDRSDWSSLEERFGGVSKPFEESYLVERMPIRGRFSQEALTLSCFLPQILYSRVKGERDVVVNTYGDLVDSFADISYINALPVSIAHHYPESGFPNSILWRLAAQAYGLPLRAASKLFSSKVLLTNSKFMQGIVKRRLKRDSQVVYPPVEVEKFRLASKSVKREDIVATFSRLRPGKRLDLIPRIAKLVKNGEFKIMGIADQSSKGEVEELKETIEGLGVGDRVKLLVNQPFQRLVDVLSSAKVYLHTQPMEAFGISIVEAMAAGCVPIVPRSGGPWLDTLEGKQGEFGFSYRSLTEAADVIEKLLEDENLRSKVSAAASERANFFDCSTFERRIVEIVEKVGAAHRRGDDGTRE